VRVRRAGDLTVDHLRRSQQHPDVEQRVDARLRREEVRHQQPPSPGQRERAHRDRRADRRARPRTELVSDHGDSRCRRATPRARAARAVRPAGSEVTTSSAAPHSGVPMYPAAAITALPNGPTALLA